MPESVTPSQHLSITLRFLATINTFENLTVFFFVDMFTARQPGASELLERSSVHRLVNVL